MERIHRWGVDSPHKCPVIRKAFPGHDVEMCEGWGCGIMSSICNHSLPLRKSHTEKVILYVDYIQLPWKTFSTRKYISDKNMASSMWYFSFGCNAYFFYLIALVYFRSFLTKYIVKYFVQILKYHTKRLKFQVYKHKNSDGSLCKTSR